MNRFFGLLRPSISDLLVKPVELVFTHPEGLNRIWTMHTLHGQAKAINDRAFDFKNYTTILAQKDLIAFKASTDEEMLVVKLSNATEALKRKNSATRSIIGRHSPRISFCLANCNNRVIYVCGGFRDQTVLEFSLTTYKFTKVSSLNQARYDASACYLSDKVYVFGGVSL